MDIDVEDATPRVNIILNRQFRLRDTGEAKHNVNAVESIRNILDSFINGLFIRYIYILKKDSRFSFVCSASITKMLNGFRPHALVDVENCQFVDTVLEQCSGADEAETLRPASHWGSD